MTKSNRREFLKRVGLGAAGLALPACAAPAAAPQKRPNVLFLFTDDQRYDTIRALGNSEIRTPNIDRLVKRGLSFTRAHIMGGTSGAVCMPSRAMLLTGRTLFHLQGRGSVIPESHALMPEVFRAAGYRTFGTGKWHNGARAYARSFTHGGKVMFGGMSDHLKVPVHDFDPTGQYTRDKRTIADGFSSEIFVDEAIGFLEKDAGDDPFFLYVSFTAPHDPRMAPEEYADLYPPESVSVPGNFLPRHPFDNGEMKIRDEKLAPWPRTPEVVREHLAAYYAMITHTDAQIGRLLDALEASGRAEETIIVFSGDNGLAVGRHGLLGKQNLYDHSVRVPLVISGPGVPAGERRDGLCLLNDLFPTLCDMTGLPTPSTVEGQSLVPMIADGGAPGRDSLYLAYTRIQRGLRTADDWKLILYNSRGEQHTQLFDLSTDPLETTNLAGEPAHAGRLESLTALLRSRAKALDDFCDLDREDWGLPREVVKKKKVNHLAKGRTPIRSTQASPKYTGGGPGALTDGVRATVNIHDGSWQGFEGVDLDVTIDLGKSAAVKKVSAGFLREHGSWIFLPLAVEIALSTDGVDFGVAKKIAGENPKSEMDRTIRDFAATFDGAGARFVRVRATAMKTCPKWHAGDGGKAWLFADEIVVK